jgi:hypothetical protein
MITLRLKSRGESVHVLEELLVHLDYNIKVSNYFGVDTHNAILDFQRKKNLVVDGIVGIKTWSKLLASEEKLTSNNDKLLSEQNLKEFAITNNLELATIKAVNAVESSGKGFFLSGRPKILFEGHQFWKALKRYGINPEQFVNENNNDVLFKKWTKIHYKGGEREYDRLKKAENIGADKAFKDAAKEAASWGAFQIMGFHWKTLGYPSIDDFVAKMHINEGEHLKAFGKFLEANRLIRKLQNKDWAGFARGYNGAGFKQNKYDEKLQKAYDKFKSM